MHHLFREYATGPLPGHGFPVSSIRRKLQALLLEFFHRVRAGRDASGPGRQQAVDYELVHLLNRPDSVNSVIALPPSGLMGGYLRVIKKVRGTTVVITDKPERLLERTTFYDLYYRPIEKEQTPKEMKMYLNEIKKDITYFSVKMTSGDFD